MLLTLLLFAASFKSFAQNVALPQKEFVLSLSEESVKIVRGESKTIQIRSLKSKAYQKSEMKMGLSSSLPIGLQLSFTPENGKVDLTQATITASPEITPGEYSVILNSTINYKTKGSILEVTIE